MSTMLTSNGSEKRFGKWSREHWQAIEAVASELLKRNELTGAEIEAIVASNSPSR